MLAIVEACGRTKLEKGFVHQRRRLHGGTGVHPPPFAARKRAHIVVEKWQQLGGKVADLGWRAERVVGQGGGCAHFATTVTDDLSPVETDLCGNIANRDV